MAFGLLLWWDNDAIYNVECLGKNYDLLQLTGRLIVSMLIGENMRIWCHKRSSSCLGNKNPCWHSGFSNIIIIQYFNASSKAALLDEAYRTAVSEHQQDGKPISRDLAYHLVHNCRRLQDLELGRCVQSLIVYAGLDSVGVLADYLIRLFASGGQLVEAGLTFCKVAEPNLYTWNAITSAYAKEEDWALQLFEKSRSESIVPNKYTFLSTLKACTKMHCITYGRQLHEVVINNTLQFDIALGSTLVDMYGKCGNLEEARSIFKALSNRDVVLWNVMIAAYVQHGEALLALCCFDSMQYEAVKPDGITFLSIIKACVILHAIEQGRYIHEQVIAFKLQLDTVGNTLVDMYAKCGSLKEAFSMFSRLPKQDIVSWNTMLLGYVQHNEGLLALDCFNDMQHHGIKADEVTFLSIMKACGITGATEQARHIHQQIIRNVLQCNVVILNSLVDMYVKCGNFEEACRVFDGIPDQDVVSWNILFAGYSQKAESHIALHCFSNMQQRGTKPNKVSYLGLLKACSSLHIEQGRQIHEMIIESELQSDTVVGSSLIDMYGKCGNLEEAHKIFERLQDRTVVTWSAMIAGYVQHGEGLRALIAFETMQNDGINPDNIIFWSVVKACGSICALEEGRCIHEMIIACGVQFECGIANTLIDMYCMCGHLAEASILFDKMPNRNVGTWGAIITGYAERGDGLLALSYLRNMQWETIEPSTVTFLSILKACSSIENLRCIHEHIIGNGYEFDINVVNTIIDVYFKCGNLDEARIVFDKLIYGDLVSWNIVIAGYTQHGEALMALECFESMKNEDVKPDAVTFLNILKACGNMGVIQHARRINEQISRMGLQTDLGNSIIEMYARCGSLEEARTIFKSLPNRNVVAWNAIIAGYAQVGDVEFVVRFLKEMQLHDFKLDDKAFTAILAACSYTGAVDEGLWYFKKMETYYFIMPDIFHVTCMVDLFGRAGYFKEAEGLLKMAISTDVCLWTTLLNACRIHNNLELGKLCFDRIVRLTPSCGAAYVLISNILATNL